MYTKIKVDSLDQTKVGQKRIFQNNDKFTKIKVQKLEIKDKIKDEKICYEDEFKCNKCETVCKDKKGLSCHKNNHLTEE